MCGTANVLQSRRPALHNDGSAPCHRNRLRGTRSPALEYLCVVVGLQARAAATGEMQATRSDRHGLRTAAEDERSIAHAGSAAIGPSLQGDATGTREGLGAGARP